MALLSQRNLPFFYLISVISLAELINSVIEDKTTINEITKKCEKNKVLAVLILCECICISYFIAKSVFDEYVDKKTYPVDAVEYIHNNNIDISNMHIYNHFDFGSYLELKGIPVFIDSRSGIYCEEFNDTYILKDWAKTSYTGKMNYIDTFEKYNITHALLYKDEIINTYIVKDKNYNKLYEDDYFILYEKIN